MAVSTPVRLDPMALDDLPAVQEIERLSFSSPWPTYALEQELTANRLARYVVARAGDTIVAFAGVWLMVDDAHITTFSVHPDWRRHGVGQQLLMGVADLAREIGARRLTLEVRASNEAAQRLYERFGFDIVGRRKAYYTDNGEDALIMTTPPLGHPPQARLLGAIREELTGIPEPDR
ncbi:MAG: ribosomal protein S18-alanine N-acetyltransferase [Chloroflexota bacterium]